MKKENKSITALNADQVFIVKLTFGANVFETTFNEVREIITGQMNVLVEEFKPSQSVEDFLKEKGIYENSDELVVVSDTEILSMESLKGLLTEFAALVLPDTGDIEEKYLYFLANEKPTDNYISATDKRIIFNWFKDNGYLRKPITEDELIDSCKKVFSEYGLNAIMPKALSKLIALEILTLINR